MTDWDYADDSTTGIEESYSIYGDAGSDPEHVAAWLDSDYDDIAGLDGPF